MELVVEETESWYAGKTFLSEFEIDEYGTVVRDGAFRDICEVVGRDH